MACLTAGRLCTCCCCTDMYERACISASLRVRVLVFVSMGIDGVLCEVAIMHVHRTTMYVSWGSHGFTKRIAIAPFYLSILNNAIKSFEAHEPSPAVALLFNCFSLFTMSLHFYSRRLQFNSNHLDSLVHLLAKRLLFSKNCSCNTTSLHP